MSEGTARLSEKIDPRTDFLAAAEWIINHYLSKDPRLGNLKAAFYILATKKGGGVSVKDIENELQVSNSTASYTLRRAVEISNRHSHAFPLIITRTEVSDLSIPIRKRSVYSAALNPEAVLLNVYLGHSVRTGDKLPIDVEETRKRLAAILDKPGLDLTKKDVLTHPPENADAIISNASWCFREERGDLRCLRAMTANRRDGFATHITALQQRLDIETPDFLTHGCILEKISTPHAFQGGFIALQAKGLPMGYYSVEFLSEECRRVALGCHYRPGGLRRGEDSPFYFDTDATDFNFENFRERIRAIKEGKVSTYCTRASDERQLAIFQYVAKQNSKGIYPSAADIMSATGISRRNLSTRVRISKEARYDISMYIRDRNSRGGFECKLLKKVRGA